MVARQKFPPFPPWPVYGEDEIQAVAAVLRSGRVNYLVNFLASPGLSPFEQAYADHCGVDYAVAVANGTLALELALYALDIGPGDEVIVPSCSFIASACCIAVRGARPVFADIREESRTIDPAAIRQAITPRTRAILVVHLAGWPCDMDPILALAREHGLRVVEDCAQAHGATYQGRPVGGLGDVAAFSFCTDKIISTGGEGGMLVTRDPQIWQKAWSYKDHGKSYQVAAAGRAMGGARMLYERFGTNWRLTAMQSAIGLVQLGKLPGWLAARRRNARQLQGCFAALPGLRVAVPPPGVGHAYYKYYVQVRPETLKADWSRERILAALQEMGLPCQQGSDTEIYLEKAFQQAGWSPPRRLPVARLAGETSLALPVHPGLGEDEMGWICQGMAEVMGRAVLSR